MVETGTILVRGASSFLKGEAVDAIVKSVESELDVHRVDAKEDSTERLESILKEASAWGPERAVVLSNSDKAEASLIQGYVKNPIPGRLVLLVSSDQSRHKKWFRELPVDRRIEPKSPKRWEKPDWLVDRARRQGYELDKNLAQSLHWAVGENLNALANELKKLLIHCDGQERIELEDARGVIYQHAEVDPFEICGSWGRGDQHRAMRLALLSRDRGASSVRMVHILSDHVEKLLLARSMYDAGSQSEIPSALGIPPFIWREKVRAQVRNRTIGNLLDAQDIAAQIDCLAKSGTPGWPLVLYFLATT